jgi:hypothetical protein
MSNSRAKSENQPSVVNFGHLDYLPSRQFPHAFADQNGCLAIPTSNRRKLSLDSRGDKLAQLLGHLGRAQSFHKY